MLSDRLPPVALRIANNLRRLFLRVTRVHTHGVTGLVLDDHGRICMVRHSYMRGWFLPGGGQKRDETPAEAVCREVREEAGIEVDGAVPRLVERYVLGGRNHVELFEITKWRQVPHRSAEIAEVRFVDPRHLPPGASRDTRRRVARWLAAREA